MRVTNTLFLTTAEQILVSRYSSEVGGNYSRNIFQVMDGYSVPSHTFLRRGGNYSRNILPSHCLSSETRDSDRIYTSPQMKRASVGLLILTGAQSSIPIPPEGHISFALPTQFPTVAGTPRQSTRKRDFRSSSVTALPAEADSSLPLLSCWRMTAVFHLPVRLLSV